MGMSLCEGRTLWHLYSKSRMERIPFSDTFIAFLLRQVMIFYEIQDGIF